MIPCSKSVEFIFHGRKYVYVYVYVYVRLRVILAAERVLNSLLEGSETYFCFSNMIISSKVTGKIKTETNNNKSSLKNCASLRRMG